MVKTNIERISQLEEMVEQLKRTVELQQERYENIVTELQTMKQQSTDNTNTIKQMMNDIDTKLIIESAKREKEIRNIEVTKREEINCKTNNIDIPMPTFSGEAKEHPKIFLKELNSYLTHKNVRQTDRLIVIENCLKGTASKWYAMIKDTMPTEEMFRTLFLKHFFSEDRQWNIFIKCTEAGKQPIKNNFQEHFHFWMAELKHLDSPKMDELQAINLITKHFPISVQAYLQTTQEKFFLNIWEKLGELETGQIKSSQEEQYESTGRQNIQRNNIRYDQTPTKNNQIQNSNSQHGPGREYNSQPRASMSQYERNNRDTNFQVGRQMSQQPIQKMQQQQYGKTAVKQMSLHDEKENQENEVDTEEEESDDQKNWEQGIAEGDRSQL